jgi:hypothetical protein
MLSDITSDQRDSTQCRHCGVTLATNLLSCPSCGANQLDPLGWYSPSAASASVRLPPPASSIAPQLAAPAAWNTPAGVEDDRFHAKYDPWRAPRRSPFVWVIAGLVVLFLVAAVAGYIALRPSSPVIAVVPKAVSGTVLTQQAVPRAAVPAPAAASSVVTTAPSAPASLAAKPASPATLVAKPPASVPLAARPATPAPLVVNPSLAANPSASVPLAAKSNPPASLATKPAASATLAAKPAAPASFASKLPEAETAAPKAVAPKQASQLANLPPAVAPSRTITQAAVSPAPVAQNPAAQNPAAHVATAQSSAARSAAVQSSTAPRPIAQTPPVSKPASSTPAIATASRPSTVVPKPAPKTLAAAPHPATSSTPDVKRDAITKANVNGKPDQVRPEVTRNLQIARAMLQKDNLTAAESHLSAALATQPKNQEALDMRTDLTGREQQRDAALDVARGCMYMERWNCAWHNAGNALVVDSGSAEAKSIIAQAMNEAQPPAKSAATPAQPIQSHEPPDHH